MKYLVNSSEMRFYDKQTSEVFGVPSLLLMEQAALAACEELEKIANKTEKILIVCGVGNNGGDGLAVGRILHLRGYQIELVLIGDRDKATNQNRKQQEILAAYGISISKAIPEKETYQIIVDAIFGVGLTRTVTGIYKDAIEAMNRLSGYKVALDIPSGVSADNGFCFGTAFRADLTITFAFDKVGLHLWPGNEKTGTIVVKEIGITEKSFLGQNPKVRALEESDLLPLLNRPSHSNKGTYGKLLLVAGSRNMAGAAILAGKAAYSSGCGLVRILTPEENRIIIQTALPEAILTTYDTENLDIDLIKDAVQWANAIVIGPGLSTAKAAEAVLECVLTTTAVPLILDADALNIVAKDMTKLKHTVPVIITPHLGEMSRLTKKGVSEIQENLMETAEESAKKYEVTCILKDERTIICTPDGEVFLNLSGNAGMATAGSGDVLSGIAGSILAQGYSEKETAALAVYLHGLSGDYMIKETGKAGLTASDLIQGMRKIFAYCSESS